MSLMCDAGFVELMLAMIKAKNPLLCIVVVF